MCAIELFSRGGLWLRSSFEILMREMGVKKNKKITKSFICISMIFTRCNLNLYYCEERKLRDIIVCVYDGFIYFSKIGNDIERNMQWQLKIEY